MTSLPEQVRSFNRMVAICSGALEESYLGRRRPLGEVRMLFEIGPEGCEIAVLRDRLKLDSGYASRLLGSLRNQGLLIVESGQTDRRRKVAKLTAEGLSEWKAYDHLSDDLVRDLLVPLSQSQQERLSRAMAEVVQLMNAASVTIAAEPADSPDARRCIAAYFEELGKRFENGFDPGEGGYAGKSLAAGMHEVFLVARLHGKAIGCGALKRLDARTAEIKRMWVDPDARGLGVARRILAALENEARRVGALRVVLDTNRSLSEAQTLYRKAGYRETDRYNDNSYADFWFAKDLQAQP